MRIKDNLTQRFVNFINMTFSYSMLFLAIDLISYFTLIDLMNALLSGGPTWLENLAESLVPAIVGAVICALPMGSR